MAWRCGGLRSAGRGSWERGHVSEAGLSVRDVYLVGTAQDAVTMNGELHLGPMGADVVHRAIADARIDPARVGSLHVGNMMSGTLSNQQQLGSLIADYAGLAGMEASCSE